MMHDNSMGRLACRIQHHVVEDAEVRVRFPLDALCNLQAVVGSEPHCPRRRVLLAVVRRPSARTDLRRDTRSASASTPRSLSFSKDSMSTFSFPTTRPLLITIQQADLHQCGHG